MGVVLLSDKLYVITKAGYLAETSEYIQHRQFADWVKLNTDRFRAVLQESQRICGDWLTVAHGTLYALPHEPFVVFDIMYDKHVRLPYDEFMVKIAKGEFKSPNVVSDGPPISIAAALDLLGTYGTHGALEDAEGLVWRVERNRLINKRIGFSGGRKTVVDFLVKYVRQNKVDGKYLGGEPIYNNYSI